jgi:hypothetical protein
VTRIPIDVLEPAVRAAARALPEVATLRRALAAIEGSAAASARDVDTLVARLIAVALEQHDLSVRRTLAQIDPPLVRLLADIDALRAGRSIGGRTAGMAAADMTALVAALEDLRTFQQWVNAMPADAEAAAQLRNAMRAEVGIQPAMTPMGSRPLATPPPLGRTAPAGMAQAVDALHTAMLEEPRVPATRAVPPSAPGRTPRVPEARGYGELVGDLPPRVAAAADAVVAAAGGDHAQAIRQILAGGTSADADRMVATILRRRGELTTGTRAARAPAAGPVLRPGSAREEGFNVQESLTGWPGEGTGTLNPPVDGFDTIGIDGLGGGRVLDSKYAHTPPPVHVDPGGSVRVTNPVDTPWGPERLSADLSELRRQLEFSRRNGLNGVEIRCSTAQQRAYWEALYGAELRGRYPGALTVTVTGR